MSIFSPQFCSAEQFQQVGSLCYSGGHTLLFGLKIFHPALIIASILGVTIGMISWRMKK